MNKRPSFSSLVPLSRSFSLFPLFLLIFLCHSPILFSRLLIQYYMSHNYHCLHSPMLSLLPLPSSFPPFACFPLSPYHLTFLPPVYTVLHVIQLSLSPFSHALSPSSPFLIPSLRLLSPLPLPSYVSPACLYSITYHTTIIGPQDISAHTINAIHDQRMYKSTKYH